MNEQQYEELHNNFAKLLAQIVRTQQLFTELGALLDSKGMFEANLGIFKEQMVLLQMTTDTTQEIVELLNQIDPDGMFWDPNKIN